MTEPQLTILVILGLMLVLFLWDRLRYDVVALLALLAAVLTHVIPAKEAFTGFSNEVLPLIAGALVVSAAIGRSGLVEWLIRRLAPVLVTRDLQAGILVAVVTLLSAFMKNIGALAIFLPVAMQVARRAGRSPSELLMPLAFGSLLGGLATLIGTSPNILIAGIRAQLTGKPFEMFDFTPVGGVVAVAGIAFLAFGWRLLPKGRRPPASAEGLFSIDDYVAELVVPKGSPVVDRTVAELEKEMAGEVRVRAIIREEFRRTVPGPDWRLLAGDVLVVEGGPNRLAAMAGEGGLALAGSAALTDEADEDEAPGGRRAPALSQDRIAVVEAVVGAASPLVGATPAELHLRQRFGVNLLAVSSGGRERKSRLRRTRFESGDVIVLQGAVDDMPEKLAALGCLPLAEREIRLGRKRQTLLPVLILAGAMVAAGTEVVPAAIAFVAAAVLVALFRILTLREIYESIEWPILILLGALIPVGEAVQHTGATALIAGGLAHAAGSLPPMALVALVMAVTMLLTPILHHAAAVIVMGPVAAGMATQLGLAIDPFLMAVAVGAGSDFLSPIGHQCNTLVLGPGGYRFGDYWRLGLPLSLIVLVLGTLLIVTFWPLR